MAIECNVPVTKTSQLINSLEDALVEAEKIGYPVMLKCSGGGGGIGMFKCQSSQDIKETYPIARQKADNIFKGSAIFLEQYISKAHHIEIQIIGNGKGDAFSIDERECSIQRRNQKVIEESPSPFMSRDKIKAMAEDAVRLCKHMNYRSIGTVEFVVDDDTMQYYFLEVNTRLQVEHPVTELTHDIDLVDFMFRLAFYDEFETLKEEVKPSNGHAIELRVYAENPLANYSPSSGKITYCKFPEHKNIRVDRWIESDAFVSPNYDPLLAKIISFGENRNECIEQLINYLKECVIQGITTNVLFLEAILQSSFFESGRYLTKNLEDFKYISYCADIIDGGMYSLIQDFPGRVGYWHIGICPSGPMDQKSYKIANWLVGNSNADAGIEILLDGLSIKFYCETYIGVAGAACDILINGKSEKMYESLYVPKDGVVSIKLNSSKGCRVYLSIQGGIQSVPYLGSRSIFASGKFGGLTGEPLKVGDQIPLTKNKPYDTKRKWSSDQVPEITNEWSVYAMAGPHGAYDYFTGKDGEGIWKAEYKVSHNANRLGIRLETDFVPEWARNDGGDAGLHPSNVHDYTYPVGAVNFSGNIPIILTADGPSLGGFVCPITIIESDLWKIGQVRPLC